MVVDVDSKDCWTDFRKCYPQVPKYYALSPCKSEAISPRSGGGGVAEGVVKQLLDEQAKSMESKFAAMIAKHTDQWDHVESGRSYAAPPPSRGSRRNGTGSGGRGRGVDVSGIESRLSKLETDLAKLRKTLGIPN